MCTRRAHPNNIIQIYQAKDLLLIADEETEINFACGKAMLFKVCFQMLVPVEKSQFSIGLISFCADQFSSCALLKSKIACLHVSFTTYEYFYKLSKSASFSRWLHHPVTQKNQ